MVCLFVFFFNQKTAYVIRISYWSSDVCSSDLLGGFVRDVRFVVVTDENVAVAQLPRLTNALAQGGIRVEPIVLPVGEGSKSWEVLEILIDRLLELGVERNDH